MAQAIVDPADLRRFALNLKQFAADVQSRMTVLHGQMVGLSDTWRDQEHERFAGEFQHTMQMMARFLDTANEHITFLLRKAERIEEYLQQR